MTPILQANPGASYHAHREEIDQAIARVINSGRYILGDEVRCFEQEFGDYLGVTHVIATASGTDALHLALLSCGIGRDDAVITVSHTAVATIAAIELAGAFPLLVDVDPGTFTMDSNLLEQVVVRFQHRFGTRLKAIIAVHLYGHPAEMEAILNIATRFGLQVIEDCSQSHGASYNNRKTGQWGNVATFSFYPTKNLGAMGDGGAVVTNDAKQDETLRILREYGWRRRYISEVPGMNSRLDEIQAAILRVKLKYLEEENVRRAEIARLYDEELERSSVILPRVRKNAHHVYHQYVIRVAQRDQLQKDLRESLIHTGIHYPVPVHLQPAYRNRLISDVDGLPETEKLCGEILSLPMYPQLTDEEVRRVGQAISDCRKRTGS